MLGFMAQNLGYRHGETMLREHGRARTKERQAERGRKVARGSVPRRTVVPRVVFAVSLLGGCLLYTSPSPRDGLLSRMPSSA